VTKLVNSIKYEGKTGKLVEKMELALGYVENMKVHAPNKVSEMPKRGSRRVVSQIKRKELIG